MNKHLEEADQLLASTDWYLFQLQASGYPRELCGPKCEEHRDDGPGAMEDCDCLFCHAGYAATRDLHRLTEMWERYPNGLLAVRTGLKSNLVVVDCDVHPGGADGLAALRELRRDPEYLPDTWMAQTGGGGKHLFYAHPGEHLVIKSAQGKPRPGIDIKGENSYVILPPSTKAGKERGYDWFDNAAPWEMPLATLSGKAQSDVAEENHLDLRVIEIAVDFHPMMRQAFEDAMLKVKYAQTGERNSTFFRAACRGGEAIYAGALTHAQVTTVLTEAGGKLFSEHEVKKTMRSGIRTGMADAQRGYVRDVR